MARNSDALLDTARIRMSSHGRAVAEGHLTAELCYARRDEVLGEVRLCLPGTLPSAFVQDRHQFLRRA